MVSTGSGKTSSLIIPCSPPEQRLHRYTRVITKKLISTIISFCQPFDGIEFVIHNDSLTMLQLKTIKFDFQHCVHVWKKLNNLLRCNIKIKTTVSKIFKQQLFLVPGNHQTFAMGLTKRTLRPDSLIQKRFLPDCSSILRRMELSSSSRLVNTSGFLSLILSFSAQCSENQTGTWDLFGDTSGKVKVKSSESSILSKSLDWVLKYYSRYLKGNLKEIFDVTF